MLAGNLTDDDEAAILEELSQLTGVEETVSQLDQLPDAPTDQLPEIGRNEITTTVLLRKTSIPELFQFTLILFFKTRLDKK